ncbi:MAG: leader peptidase (prepilin peptidase) / N-methyltransferase [Solirubrobacterales bacterium]|jgi:leader peptidase (prepilin peptidase)/N-methyltransferase|nr:leader peptidase (prepilin peptidase) / N-methyltransferase [Solirubrobacterales bacterium]
MAVPALIALFAGAFAGSFLTVVAHRVPRKEGFVTGRSRCPRCGAQIAAYDNVPIVSWLLLRGRCRSCGEPISARYPVTEAATGLLWAGTVLALGTDDAGELVLGLLLCSVLVAVTLTDLELRIIPNALVLFGALAGIAVVLVFGLGELDQRAIAVAVAGGAFVLIALAYPRGMGMGDAKLVAMMAIYLGRSIAPAVLIGLLAGSILGLAMIARGGAAARKSAVPFGPFLALGGVAGLWFGDEIVDWYLDNFTG